MQDNMSHETVVQVPVVSNGEEVHDLRTEVAQLVNVNNVLVRQRDELATQRDEYEQRCHDALACQREAERELANFKTRVRDRMIQEANRRQWCSEFDDILVEFGMEPRTKDWTVTYTITAQYERTVRAGDADRAEQLVGEELPWRDGGTYAVNGVYVTITDIECDEVVAAE